MIRSRVLRWFDTGLLHFWRLAPRGVLRVVPGTSEAFGPPRRMESWNSFRQRTGARWRSVAPAHDETLPPPFFCNDAAVRFNVLRSVRWPEAGVAEIPRARLLEDHGWVVAPNDRFLFDFCQQGAAWHSRVNRIVKLAAPRDLPGRTLNLSTAWGGNNFFHALADGLSRWSLVRAAGYTWNDFDQVILPGLQTPTTAAVERAIGVPTGRIQRLHRRDHVRCEQLVQPSFPGFAALKPDWVIAMYREYFPAPDARTRKIYLGRRSSRRIENDRAVEATLVSRGFESIAPETAENVPQLLAQATHVVAVHGAAMANLVFCAPGTRVLELAPTDVAHHPEYFTYFYGLCATGGMPYGMVTGRSAKTRRHPFSRQTLANFQVDPKDLDAGIAALLNA